MSLSRQVARMAQPNFRFEEFELNVDNCELRRSGQPVKVERIPLELLILLLQNSGKLVRREAINERLWGNGVFIETEHGINTAINKLRATLRDDSRDPRFIRTIVGRGYCFIAEVNVMQPIEAAPVGDKPGVPISQAEANSAFPLGNGHKGASHASEAPTPAPSTSETSQIVSPQSLDEQGVERAVRGRRRRAGLIISFLVLLAVVGAVFLLFKPQGPQRQMQATGPHSIAVLPFRNLARESDQDYLVDGMTDQLITDLGKNPSLRVISYSSVMQYKGVQSPVQETARQLNVDMIVEGSYLRAGQKVHITAQLLDSRTTDVSGHKHMRKVTRICSRCRIR